MNTQRTSFSFPIWFIALFSLTIHAQKSFNSLGESALSIGHDVSRTYRFNFTLRSRYFLYKHNTLNYQQQQLDIFHLSTFKLIQRLNTALGVYYRNRDWFNTGSDELRLMEELNYKISWRQKLFKHRFRAEQRIFNTKTIYRQRYKLGTNVPLLPLKKLNTSTYLSTSLEALWSLSKQIKGETDIRITAQIVWPFLKKQKLKTGIEHRLEAFNLKAKNNLFILTSASFNI